MDVVLFTGSNICEIVSMLLRQCSDEWIAHALFDAAEFTVGNVYYVDEDVLCSITSDEYEELRNAV